MSVTRRDHIVETSLGVYAENATRWLPWFRSVVGLRGDTYRFDVKSDLAANTEMVQRLSKLMASARTDSPDFPVA